MLLHSVSTVAAQRRAAKRYVTKRNVSLRITLYHPKCELSTKKQNVNRLLKSVAIFENVMYNLKEVKLKWIQDY